MVSDQFSAPIDRPVPIDWNSKITDLIPGMLGSLVFRRYFALCLVRKKVWESPDTSLAVKLGQGLFWDYCGNQARSSRAVTWRLSRVREINAIQKLGSVGGKRDRAIDRCTRSRFSFKVTSTNKKFRCSVGVQANTPPVYARLCKDWVYYEIWWNSADFALALGCLLVGDTAARRGNRIMRRLADLRDNEVVHPRVRACERGFYAGFSTCCAAVVLMVGTGGAAAPVAVPAALGGWGVAFGSGMTTAALDTAVDSRRDKRQEQCLKVRSEFVSPALTSLFSSRIQYHPGRRQD